MVDYSVPQNLLLRAAFKARRLSPEHKLKHIVFEPGQQFWKDNEPTQHVLFPERGILSLQIASTPAKRVEVALVGREGLAGISLFLASENTLTTAVAVTAGEVLAMPAKVFQAYLRSPRFKEAVLRYAQSFVSMLANISVCNRIHVIEKLCVGHLLLMQDRTQASSFQVTQDFFSRLLGVRRATVSRAAARLQRQGVIQYDRRGRLTILDRRQLEKAACSCYHAIKADFDRLIDSQGGF